MYAMRQGAVVDLVREDRLGRFTDDRSQPRFRAEAEAVEHIMGMIRAGTPTGR
jgi:hypothetical protein